MKYTIEHEWLKKDGDILIVGITEHASCALGDVVFVELPTVGSEITTGEEICVIESVKAASDILAPLDGIIVEINEELIDNTNLVNDDPLGKAWFFKMKPNDMSVYDSFMDETEYNNYIG